MTVEVLVTYDVNTETKEGERRLRRVAKICEGYGHRIQQSVFECIVDQVSLLRLAAALEDAIDPDLDSVMLYRLREPYQSFVRRIGRAGPVDPRQPFVI